MDDRKSAHRNPRREAAPSEDRRRRGRPARRARPVPGAHIAGALFSLALAGALFGALPARAAVGPYPGERTWESPPVTTQLLIDDTIIPVGKGAVFCPVMTQSENEPPFGIIQDGRRIDDAPMGSRVALAPGIYTVVVGSGTIDQMMPKKIRVEEGATTLIKPDWAGLVVEVIDERRSSLRESYEILDAASGRSFGVGQGVTEDLDERLRTWILPPGLYKIVKPGDNLNAVVNFGTIRLAAGELIRTHLVVDETSGSFLGFGEVTDVRQTGAARRRQRWVSRTEISGNMLLNYTPASQEGSQNDAGLAASVQLLSDTRYHSGRHVVPIWLNIEEGLSVDRDRDVSKFVDQGELRLTYIYRLRDWFSPYLRGAVETRFFATQHRFEEPTDYVELDQAQDTVRAVRGADEIRLADPFSPVQVKRGAGLTAAVLQTIPANLNVRAGYGVRRSYARGAFVYDAENRTLTRAPETDISGMEFLTLGDFRLGRYILVSGEFDMLAPAWNADRWVYDSETRLRVNLTRHVNVVLQFDFWKDPTFDDVQVRYQGLLRFSRNL